MKKFYQVTATILFAVPFALPLVGCTPLSPATQAQNQDAADQLTGLWEGDGPSDARAHQHTVLELRADHTYTKTLQATVDGQSYGGTHSGTWTARGMIVDLSGDGNFPAYSQDLRLLHKVK